MSAWIVSKKHIDVLVRGLIEAGGYMHRGTWHQVNLENASEVGHKLWRENHKSVNYRYSERTRTPAYAYEEPVEYLLTGNKWNGIVYVDEQTRILPGVLAKQTACFNYQTCEHDGYYGSEVRSMVLELSYHLLHNVEGSDAAEWGV